MDQEDNRTGHGHAWDGVTTESAHRLAWRLFIGSIPDSLQVLHREYCGITACVNPEHLYLGTHRQNQEDRMRWGRGVGNGNGQHHRTAVYKDGRWRNDISSNRYNL